MFTTIPTQFIEFLVIATISLAFTFVLFKKLDSYAEGKAKLLGGPIKYGGSLGGFLVVFIVLFSSYSSMAIDGEKTTIDISGKWDIALTVHGGDGRQFLGTAVIHQPKGSAIVRILGNVENSKNPPSISFSSRIGILRDARLLFVYENENREMGIALGDILSDKPERFSVKYYDVLSTNKDDDPEGRIVFSR